MRAATPLKPRKCRVCGCTDEDCSQCIEKTGSPCYWVERALCSACAQELTIKAGQRSRVSAFVNRVLRGDL